MQDNAPHQLDIKVALSQGSLGGFPNGGEGFGEKLIQGTACLKPGLKLVSLGAKLGIAKLLKFRLKLIYPIYGWL